MNFVDNIINHYNSNHNIKKTTSIHFDEFTITNPNYGVGDALSLYVIDSVVSNKKIHTIINHPSIRQELQNFNSLIGNAQNSYSRYHSLINVWDIQLHSSYGGHFLQKIQQFIGLPVDIVPKPKLSSNIATIKNKVVMTFDKGAVDQRHIHPQARLIYQQSKDIIQKFINDHLHIYSFVEVGRYSLGLDNVENKTNIGIRQTAEEIASCDYFFANHNGLMHIAAGLNKKSIIIINFPKAEELVLPCLYKTNVPDIDWLYPQNTHLHQDNESLLVKKLSYDNIKKAFNHELYPFFSNQYIEKTFEYL